MTKLSEQSKDWVRSCLKPGTGWTVEVFERTRNNWFLEHLGATENGNRVNSLDWIEEVLAYARELTEQEIKKGGA